MDCGPHGTCDLGECECDAGWQLGTDGTCSDPIPCYGKDCGHGDCNDFDDVCVCDLYWELSDDSTCNTPQREKFLGTWMGSHAEDGTTVGPYTMTINTGLEVQDILITNFLNKSCLGGPLQATSSINIMDGFTSFNFSCGNYSSGTLELSMFSADQISLSGGATLNGDIVQITGLFTRQ